MHCLVFLRGNKSTPIRCLPECDDRVQPRWRPQLGPRKYLFRIFFFLCVVASVADYEEAVSVQQCGSVKRSPAWVWRSASGGVIVANVSLCSFGLQDQRTADRKRVVEGITLLSVQQLPYWKAGHRLPCFSHVLKDDVLVFFFFFFNSEESVCLFYYLEQCYYRLYSWVILRTVSCVILLVFFFFFFLEWHNMAAFFFYE